MRGTSTEGSSLGGGVHERLRFAGKLGVLVLVVLDGQIVGEVQALF